MVALSFQLRGDLVKGRIWQFGLAVVLAVAVAACGSSSSSSSSSSSGGASASTSSSTSGKFKVGLVTDIGGLNDKGFNHLAYTGLLMAESKLGIQGTVLQSTSGADYVPNLTKLAQAGNNLVISVGFLMADATAQVAKQFPNVHFAIIDNPADVAPDNVKNIERITCAWQRTKALDIRYHPIPPGSLRPMI